MQRKKTFLMKWTLTCVMAMLLVVFATGCGNHTVDNNGTQNNANQTSEVNIPSASESDNSQQNDESTENESTEDELGTTAITRAAEGEYGWLSNTEGTFPITVIDGTGEEVTIEEQPQSIITGQPSETEIAFALGLGEQIIGVSDYSNYPEEALNKEKIGGQNLNAEKIMELLPDLFFVTAYHYENHPELLDQLKELGVDIIVINSAESFEQTYISMQLIAAVTGKTQEADQLITDMQERLAQVIEKSKQVTEKANVWVEVSPAPDIFTTGTGTFMHEMLEAIGANNAAGHLEGWNKLTEEEIVALMPDVIITTYGFYIDNPAEQVYSRTRME